MTNATLPADLARKIRAGLTDLAVDARTEYMNLYGLTSETLPLALTGEIDPPALYESEYDPVDSWVEGCELALGDMISEFLPESDMDIVDSVRDAEGRPWTVPSAVATLLAEVETEVFGMVLSDPDNPDDYGV